MDALSMRIPMVSDIPTIIFGADVTHPESGEDTSPSIADVRQTLLIICSKGYVVKCSINLIITYFTGCSISRLARSDKVCWHGICSGSQTRNYTRSVQNLARPTTRNCQWRNDKVCNFALFFSRFYHCFNVWLLCMTEVCN